MLRFSRIFNSRVFATAALAVPCATFLEEQKRPEETLASLLERMKLPEAPPSPARTEFFYTQDEIEELSRVCPAPALDPSSFRSFRLLRRESISPDSTRLTFALPRENDELGITVASLVLVQGPDPDDGERYLPSLWACRQHLFSVIDVTGKLVVRPYTPTSRPHDRGQFELVVKSYQTGKVCTILACFSEASDSSQVTSRYPSG